MHTTCNTNSILLISHLLTLTGHRSQLRPLKPIGSKTVTVDLLFDLSISKSVKRFAIFGQFRASNSYEHF